MERSLADFESWISTHIIERGAMYWENGAVHNLAKSYPSFRKKAIKQAMQEKRYSDVRQLAQEGIIIAEEKNRHGTVREWKKWLIQVSEETGDTETHIQLLEEQFFNRGDMEYYKQLKAIIPKAQLNKKIASYIQHYRAKETPQKKQIFNRYVANILQAEERWEDLMEEIKKSPSLGKLDDYFDLMGQRFPTIFLNYYAQLVRFLMARTIGRGHYQKCCRYLDKIILLGGSKEAKAIAAEWRELYPKRRAMLEELRRY